MRASKRYDEIRARAATWDEYEGRLDANDRLMTMRDVCDRMEARMLGDAYASSEPLHEQYIGCSLRDAYCSPHEARMVLDLARVCWAYGGRLDEPVRDKAGMETGETVAERAVRLVVERQDVVVNPALTEQTPTPWLSHEPVGAHDAADAWRYAMRAGMASPRDLIQHNDAPADAPRWPLVTSTLPEAAKPLESEVLELDFIRTHSDGSDAPDTMYLRAGMLLAGEPEYVDGVLLVPPELEEAASERAELMRAREGRRLTVVVDPEIADPDEWRLAWRRAGR